MRARSGSTTSSKTSTQDVGTLSYLYDFGDGWDHTIKVKRLADPELALLYPRLIEVGVRCPLEDCGGPGAAPRVPFPSAEDRLPKSLHFAESDVILGVVRARSVHEVGYGHNWDWAA